MHYLTTFMNEYGYLVLFLSLTLGIMALPIPIEALMGYAGFLSFQGQLNWIGSVVAATLGCLLGMMLSYKIGEQLGMPFFEKYGKRFHLGPERLRLTSIWFEKYGNKLLLIALFIPGVRHLTGYISGITRLSFRIFTFYSFMGSFIWVSTFILLGKLLGPRWETFQEVIKKYLVTSSIILAITILLVYLVKRYKTEIFQAAVNFGKFSLRVFHSRGRAELFLFIISLFTIGFIILMIGTIQDFLGNEIHDFDEVTKLLISTIFSGKVDLLMKVFLQLGTQTLLLSVIFYTVIWILWKGRKKVLELIFFTMAVVGGEFYEELLRIIFHRLSPNEPNLLERFPSGFPSEQSLMAFVIYGFFFFMILRHSELIKVHTIMITSWIVILLFIGTSRIYFHLQEPSQIVAGYIFGGVWLGVSTLLLEIFRMLTRIDTSKKRTRADA